MRASAVDHHVAEFARFRRISGNCRLCFAFARLMARCDVAVHPGRALVITSRNGRPVRASERSECEPSWHGTPGMTAINKQIGSANGLPDNAAVAFQPLTPAANVVAAPGSELGPHSQRRCLARRRRRPVGIGGVVVYLSRDLSTLNCRVAFGVRLDSSPSYRSATNRDAGGVCAHSGRSGGSVNVPPNRIDVVMRRRRS